MPYPWNDETQYPALSGMQQPFVPQPGELAAQYANRYAPQQQPPDLAALYDKLYGPIQSVPVPPPALATVLPQPAKSFFTPSDTASALWDVATKQFLPGLKGALASSYQGLARPDQAPALVQQWQKEAQQAQQQNEEAITAQQQLGTSTSVGEAIRQAGPSLGYSVGALGASLAAAAPVAAATGGIGTLPAIGAAMAGAGALGYRMAGGQFLHDTFAELDKASVEKRGTPLSESEKQQAYNALLPIAQHTGLWEAGPEALGNAAMIGLGGVALGFLGKGVVNSIAKTALGRAGVRAGAGAAQITTEVGTEAVTQTPQRNDQEKADAMVSALRAGSSIDEAIQAGVSTQPSVTGMAAFKQSLAEVAPSTIATTLMMAGLAKPVQMIQARNQERVKGKELDAVRETLKASMPMATPEELAGSLENYDKILAEAGTLPKDTLKRMESAKKIITDELALRASPEMLQQPIDSPRGYAAFIGLADNPSKLSDEQLQEVAQRPLPANPLDQWVTARKKYQAEIQNRQQLNDLETHFGNYPEAVPGVAKELAKITAPKTVDVTLAGMDDSMLTRYRAASEILLRDHTETLGTKQTAAVENAANLLHAESDRRANGERRDPEKIAQEQKAIDIASLPIKEWDKVLQNAPIETLDRMATALEARQQLEPSLAPKAVAMRARATQLSEQNTKAQEKVAQAAQKAQETPVKAPIAPTPNPPIAPAAESILGPTAAPVAGVTQPIIEVSPNAKETTPGIGGTIQATGKQTIQAGNQQPGSVGGVNRQEKVGQKEVPIVSGKGPQGEITNAVIQGQEQQNGVKKRQGTGGRLEAGRVNRNVAPKEQAGGNQAGSSNQPGESRQVTPQLPLNKDVKTVLLPTGSYQLVHKASNQDVFPGQVFKSASVARQHLVNKRKGESNEKAKEGRQGQTLLAEKTAPGKTPAALAPTPSQVAVPKKQVKAKPAEKVAKETKVAAPEKPTKAKPTKKVTKEVVTGKPAGTLPLQDTNAKAIALAVKEIGRKWYDTHEVVTSGDKFQVVPKNRESVVTTVGEVTTTGQARTEISKTIGKSRLDALEKSGKLVLHETSPIPGKPGVAGYVDEKGVIHLIPSNMDTSALSVALHEAVHVAKDDRFFEGNRALMQMAHVALRMTGLKNFIGGPSFNDLAGQVRRMAAAGNKTAQDALAKAKQVAPNNVDEESVSYLVQFSDEKLPIVRRILAAIRAALYRMGINVKLTPDDVRALAISALKKQAKAAVSNEKVAAAYSQTGMQAQDISWQEFSRVRDAYNVAQDTKTSTFQAWFGKGIEGVTSKNGKPITLYHATDNPSFTEFDTSKLGSTSGHPTAGLGFFMTADKAAASKFGSRFMQFYAKISNPYYFTDADLSKLGSVEDATKLRLKLRANGYDGGVITAPGASPYVVAFNSSQVKLTSNVAPTESPNFRYSLAGKPIATTVTGDPVLDSFYKKSGMTAKATTLGITKDALTGDKLRRNTFVKLIVDRIKEGVFDETHQGKIAEEALGIDVTDPSMSGNAAQRLATGWTEVLWHILVKGTPQWKNGVVARLGQKGLFNILLPVSDKETLREFFGWKVALRADRLLKTPGPNKKPLEQNLTRTEVDHMLNKVRSDPAKLELFEKVNKDFVQFENEMLDLAVGAGLVDKPTADKWKSTGDYLPFFRVTEGQIMGPKGTKGIANQPGFRRLTGGKAEINDPLENVIMGVASIVQRSMNNRAMQLYRDNLNQAGLMVKEPMGFRPAIVPAGQIKSFLAKNEEFAKWLKEMGLEPKDMPSDTFLGLQKLWALNAPTAPDVVKIWDNGKANYYRVIDRNLLRALKGVDRADLGNVMTVLRFFKRLLTGMVTMTPDFKLNNLVRDMVTVYTQNPNLKVRDLFTGVSNAVRESRYAIEMGFAGSSFGHSGFVNANEPGQMERTIRAAMDEIGFKQSTGPFGTVFDWTKGWWQKYQELGHRLENASRDATYEQILRDTGSSSKAAFGAKDVLDFNMRGNYKLMQALVAMLPFFNARLQGLYKLGRSGALPYKKSMFMSQVVLRGAMITLVSAALLWLNKDDPRYKALQDWEKDNYWHFFFPDWLPKSLQHIRLPKPFEIGFIYGTMLGERVPQQIMGNEKLGKLNERFWAGMSDQLAMDLIPQAIRPGWDVARNKIGFTGAPIESFSDEGKLAVARYNESTSRTMRLIGSDAGLSNVTGLSPKQMEALFRGYLGSMGMYILAASDGLVGALTGAPKGPAWEAANFPLLKSMLSPEVSKATQYQTELYNMRRDVNQIYLTVRDYAMQGRVEDAMKLVRDNASKLAQRPGLEKAAQNLTKIRDAMDVIYRDPDMTREEKRVAINNLRRASNLVSEEGATKAAVGF